MVLALERRSRNGCLLLAGAAVWLCLEAFSRSGSNFIQNGRSSSSHVETFEGRQASDKYQVSRSEILRWLPAVAIGSLGMEPSRGASGVTEAWKVRPDGSEDDIHTGGVEWEDVKVGTGASPQIGQMVAVNYVVKANVREKEVTVDDTKGQSRDFRFGIGQMLPGMDEGIAGMKTGGTRVLRIPGGLAFGKKAVPAAVGRPNVPPFTPVEVTVTLEFIPGADDVYKYGEDDAVDK